MFCLGDAVDVTEPHADALLFGRDPLDPVAAGGGVDVDGQERYAQAAGFCDEEAPGVHAGVVFEDPGEELDRIPGLQPRGLVRGQCEACAVGFAEPERPEGPDGLPDPVDVPIREDPSPVCAGT